MRLAHSRPTRPSTDVNRMRSVSSSYTGRLSGVTRQSIEIEDWEQKHFPTSSLPPNTL